MLLELVKQLKITFIQNRSLADVDEKLMNDIINMCEKYFDIYLIDEIDYNASELKQYYKIHQKKKLIEELRKNNREKRKKSKFDKK